MTDIWTKEKRSDVMSRIRSRDTTPERLVRRMLSRLGYRYRLNVLTLPGKPDIVLRRLSSIVLVHGCFWHLHTGCRDGRIPQSRLSYWQDKLNATRRRDRATLRKLRDRGWKVLRLWECEIERRPALAEKKLTRLLSLLP